jgi:hypothetical protein
MKYRKASDKWRAIAEGRGDDDGLRNCPLCQEYYWNGGLCCNCPVSMESGGAGCWHTPYTKWAKHQDAKHGRHPFFRVRCPTCERLALDEYLYLLSLGE